MVWSAENSKNDEASKIRWELVPYMLGYALDIGCGAYKVFPHFIGVDSGHHWGFQGVDIRVKTGSKLDLFADNSCDCVFSSHLLEHFEYGEAKEALKEWMRITKSDKYMVLYVPDEDEYPKVGEYGANKDHKWNISFQKILDIMPDGWDLIDFQKRNQDDEYSLFLVFQKKPSGKAQSWKHPKPAKTAAVIRYAAIGDAIQASSVLPWLKENGYHITFYCQSGPGHEVLKHDPHIDRFVVQGKDHVPPQFLGEFFEYTAKKYDRFINLCESVEGTLLAIPGRANHEWPNEARAKHQDRNYIEWTHEIALVPPPYRPKFYSTMEERLWAKEQKRQFGRKTILWSLSGSSGHKTWPHLDAVIAGLMLRYSDVHVVLVGDDLCKILEHGWGKEKRVHCRSGVWNIRQSMSFAEVADLVIGAETGLLNAAGAMETPKIVTLSHSSKEMLTKHWKNTIALEQPPGVGCTKSPCRQLHYDWTYCPKYETEQVTAALCQFHITPNMMFDAIISILEK